MVATIVEDSDNVDDVNSKLDKMGHNIGTRLVDEVLAKTGLNPGPDFREVIDILARVGFRLYLGTTPTLSNWNADMTSVHLTVGDCLLSDWVELPPSMGELSYFQVLCGVIRGALEMLGMRVEVRVIDDRLKGGANTVLSVELREMMQARFFAD